MHWLQMPIPRFVNVPTILQNGRDAIHAIINMTLYRCVGYKDLLLILMFNFTFAESCSAFWVTRHSSSWNLERSHHCCSTTSSQARFATFLPSCMCKNLFPVPPIWKRIQFMQTKWTVVPLCLEWLNWLLCIREQTFYLLGCWQLIITLHFMPQRPQVSPINWDKSLELLNFLLWGHPNNNFYYSHFWLLLKNIRHIIAL